MLYVMLGVVSTVEEEGEEGPWCCVLQILNFNVADVEFQCCRHVMLGFVSRRRAPHVGCCMQHGSQHGRNIVATWLQHWGRREEARWRLDVARNMLATWLVMAHNMLATLFAECWKHHGSQHGKMCLQHGKSCLQHQYASQQDPTADTFPNSNRVAANPSDASARIGRPGASSSNIVLHSWINIRIILIN
jgi:hypothetical protein